MNRKSIDEETSKNLIDTIIEQTVFVIAVCFLIVLAIRFMENNCQFTLDVLLFSAEIIIPLALALGINCYFTYRKSYKNLRDLADGLEKAVEGDFYAKLDPSKAGSFSKVYENFNKVTDELKNVRNMQDDFVSNYSHELKTPINAIKGFSEMLLEEDLSEEDKKKYLKIISNSADRLTNLAEESIIMTKLDSQEILEKEEYSLSEQIRNCIIMLEPSWSAKNIDLTADLDEINYNGNKEVIGHLWSNLIGNSIKYNKENGKLKISLKQDENNIIAKIEDTGIGMTEEQISHIFEKYYQAEKSKTMHGLGLGLTIVSKILSMVNGNIEVESKLGQGSTFTVIIPK